MEFSNPFDNPQDSFTSCKMRSVNSAFGQRRARFPQAGTWYANRNRRTRASSGLIRAGQH